MVLTCLPLLSLSHLQTVALANANDGEKHPDICYEREILDMPDGGIVSLDWALPARNDGTITPLAEIDPNKRTVLIHPGLTGGSSEHYIRSAVQALHRAGWQAVVMNARGCALTPLKTPKVRYVSEWCALRTRTPWATIDAHSTFLQFFCIAYTDDIRYTATYLAEKYNFQSEALVGLGYSMGANVLVKYLGEEKDQTPLTGAISVGNPFDVVKCSGNIDATLFNQLTYGKALNTNLLDLVFKKVRWGGDWESSTSQKLCV